MIQYGGEGSVGGHKQKKLSDAFNFCSAEQNLDTLIH